MPTLAAIITTAGRAALTTNTFAPVAIHVGSGSLTPTNATAALVTPEAVLAATVQAQQVGDDVRLHVVGLDVSGADYEVREWALVSAGGTFLAVYGDGATLVAAKAAGSHLHLALDVVLEEADVGSITIGDTDYLLPVATETTAGIVELATEAEVTTGTDPTRVVTVLRFRAVTDTLAKLAGGNALSGNQNLADPAEFQYAAARTKSILLNPVSAMPMTAGWAFVPTLSGGLPGVGYWECSTDNALLAYPLEELRRNGFEIAEVKVNWENTGASGRTGNNRVKVAICRSFQNIGTVGIGGAAGGPVGSPFMVDDDGAGNGTLTLTFAAPVPVTPANNEAHYLVIKAGLPSTGGNKDRVWGVQVTVLDPGPRGL